MLFGRLWQAQEETTDFQNLGKVTTATSVPEMVGLRGIDIET
jgi:hypothetical protein